MDIKRAREIINSPSTIPVLYKDKHVWIENVNENSMAEVTLEGDKNKIEVPVHTLAEGSVRFS